MSNDETVSITDLRVGDTITGVRGSAKRLAVVLTAPVTFGRHAHSVTIDMDGPHGVRDLTMWNLHETVIRVAVGS